MIQISVNNLVSKNSIITYSSKNIVLLKRIVTISTTINLLIFLLYLYEVNNPNTFGLFSALETSYKQNVLHSSIIFVIYSLGLIRIIKLVFQGKIKQDIYLFALKDKLNYCFLISYLLFAYFHIN